jgi:hypothetical protein
VLISLPRVRTLVAALAGAVVLFGGCTQTAAPTAPSPSSTLSLTANYSLYIHCGVRYASYDGDSWEAVAPIPSIAPYVGDGKGNMRGRNEIAGQMVRLSATEARFTTTEEPTGLVLHFVRMAGPIPGCA